MSLDKPCQDCGDTIYFGYKGPIEGVCGKCVDKRLRKRPARTKVRTVVVNRGARLRSSALRLGVAFLAGAAAMYLAYPYLQ